MDSFTMLFQAALSVSDITRGLEEVGLDAHGHGPAKMVVSSGEARVWIQILRPEDLDPSDFEDEHEWPIPRDRVASVFDISVRRNVESENLAVKVADRLVTRFGGAILWDGMDQWEERYKAYLATGRVTDG
jgi:hypothetical protein